MKTQDLNLNHLRAIPGLRLPDPMPPVPQIIDRLQIVIAELETRQSELNVTDVNKAKDDQLEEFTTNKNRLAILKLRLDQLLAAYPQPTANEIDSPSIKSMESIMSIPTASPEENPKNTPPRDATVDNQPTPSDADAAQCDAPATQPAAPAAQSDSQPAQSGAPSDATLDPKLQNLALEFRELRDKRSPLDHLTDAEHDAILALMETTSGRDVARLLAQPRPIGLDLKTTEVSLRRFRDRRQKNKRGQELRDKFATVQTILQNSGPLDGFLKASAHLLEARLLKSVADDQTDPAMIQQIIKSLTTLRRQALAERQQTHREKLSN